MRLALVFASSLALFACSGGSTRGPDLAARTSDLSLADSSAVGGESCFQILSCSLDCSGEASCEATCRAQGSPSAKASYDALFACAYGACMSAGDGGTGDAGAGVCASASDQSAACATCVTAAAASSTCADERSVCVGS